MSYRGEFSEIGGSCQTRQRTSESIANCFTIISQPLCQIRLREVRIFATIIRKYATLLDNAGQIAWSHSHTLQSVMFMGLNTLLLHVIETIIIVFCWTLDTVTIIIFCPMDVQEA